MLIGSYALLSVVFQAVPAFSVPTSCEEPTTVTLPFSESAVVESTRTGFTSSTCGIDTSLSSNWYQFDGTNQIVSATLSSQSSSTSLAIFKGDACGALTCVDYDRPSRYSKRNIGPVAATSGTSYSVVVTASQGGSYELSITSPPRPTNDLCSGASETPALPFTKVEDLSPAFPTFADRSCNINENTRVLWYKHVFAADGVYKAILSNQESTAGIALYSGDCDSLSCRASTTKSRYSVRFIEFIAVAGDINFFAVSGDDFDDAGEFQLDVESLPRPANDMCSGATLIPAFPFTTTEDSFPAFPTFSDRSCNINENTRLLWYRHVCTTDGVYRATLSNQGFTAGIALYSGDCDTLSCRSSTTKSRYSNRFIEFIAAEGDVNFIVVSGDDFDDAGEFQLDVESFSRPANDMCSGATLIPAFPFTSVEDSLPAFPTFSDALCDINENTRVLWYKHVCTADGVYRATLSNQEFTAGIALYSGDCDTPSCRASTTKSRYSNRFVEFVAAQGDINFIAVAGNDFDDAGEFQLDVECFPRPMNDMCSGAALIPTLPYVTVGDSFPAYPVYSDSLCGINENTRILWYRHVSNADNVYRVLLSNQEFNAGMALYSGACASPSCRVYTSKSRYSNRQIDFTSAQGNINFIVVSGNDFGDAGEFQLDLEALVRPPNDFCDGALDVSSLPYNGFHNNEGAFPSFSNDKCKIGLSSRALWYRYTPSESSLVRARVQNQGFSSYLSVVEGSSCDTLVCLGEHGPYQYSDVGLTFTAYFGKTYYLLVHGDNFAAGDFALNIEAIPRPVNDQCSGARPISLSQQLFDSTAPALPTFSDRLCNVDPLGRTVWYSFTPTVTRRYTATVSDFYWQAILSLFGGDDCDSLSCRGTESYCYVILPSYPYIYYCSFSVSWTGVAGTTYYLSVTGADGFGDAGSFYIEIN